MPINESLIAEMQQESASTKKMLERAPENSFTWKPHEKSMTLGRLAMHIAEIPMWTDDCLLKDELDFARTDYKPRDATTTAELVKFFDENVSKAIEILGKTSDEEFMKDWTMRNGEEIYFTLPKIAVVRSFIMSHGIHHRAQMSVYLRMLDVPVPGVYGPSADEESM
jgi:uncharacterized damage-inducible protein DinB